MSHPFSILTYRKSKNAPATQKFYMYFGMIWQNSCDVKTGNNSFDTIATGNIVFYIVQLGLGFKLNTKIGLQTTTHPNGLFEGV